MKNERTVSYGASVERVLTLSGSVGRYYLDFDTALISGGSPVTTTRRL